MQASLTFLSQHGGLIVAVCAVFVSTLSLHLQRRHNRLSVRPKLHFARGHTKTAAPYRWHLNNSGVGPAIIKQFEVTINQDKLVFPKMSDLNAHLQRIGCGDFDECGGFRDGEYLQANTEVILLSFPPDKAVGVTDKVHKITWNIVYESIYGERQRLKINASN